MLLLKLSITSILLSQEVVLVVVDKITTSSPFAYEVKLGKVILVGELIVFIPETSEDSIKTEFNDGIGEATV